jgi:hypothetical protein
VSAEGRRVRSLKSAPPRIAKIAGSMPAEAAASTDVLGSWATVAAPDTMAQPAGSAMSCRAEPATGMPNSYASDFFPSFGVSGLLLKPKAATSRDAHRLGASLCTPRPWTSTGRARPAPNEVDSQQACRRNSATTELRAKEPAVVLSQDADSSGSCPASCRAGKRKSHLAWTRQRVNPFSGPEATGVSDPR